VSGTATYLYAVTRPLRPDSLAGVRGIGGGTVRPLPIGGMSAIVSTVELAEFGEDSLPGNLEDLSWLGRVAREHDDVVRAVAGLATTIPLRLATVCRDDDSAARRVDAVAERAQGLLAELDGREEWGVKVFDVREPEPAGVAAGARPSSGTAYLQQRKARLARSATSAQASAEAAEQTYAQLSRLAVRGHRHRPQDPQLYGAARPMLLNAAFLVERTDAAGFQAAVERIAAERPDGAVVLTGPWPPYSFASLEEA
jgi:hypothetical protein